MLSDVWCRMQKGRKKAAFHRISWPSEYVFASRGCSPIFRIHSFSFLPFYIASRPKNAGSYHGHIIPAVCDCPGSLPQSKVTSRPLFLDPHTILPFSTFSVGSCLCSMCSRSSTASSVTPSVSISKHRNPARSAKSLTSQSTSQVPSFRML